MLSRTLKKSCELICKELILTITLIVALPYFAQTQPYIANIQYFTTTDGLSHREVQTIFQDQTEVVWIGTKNGLNRFDGYRFKHWLGKNYGVDLRNIRRIGQDDEGWLWIKSHEDFFFFNPKTEKFQTITQRFGKDCLLNKYTISTFSSNFISDDFGRIYIEDFESNEIHTYHSSEGFKTLEVPKNIQYYNILIKNDSRLTILAGEEQINLILDNSTQSINTKYQIKRRFRYNRKGISFSNFKNNWIWSLNDKKELQIFDDKDNLQLTTKDQVFERTTTMTFGNQGKTWIGTEFGFYVVELQKKKFDFIPTPTLTNLVGKSTRGITATPSALHIVFEPKGIGIYQFDTQKWTAFSGTNWNRAIHKVGESNYWIGSENQIIHWHDEEMLAYPIHHFYDFGIWSIKPSRLQKDVFWLGTKFGIYHFNTTTKVGTHIPNPFLKDKKDDYCLIQSIIPDNQNKDWLWFCSNEGLLLFDEKKKKFIASYHQDQAQEYFLPSMNIQHLYQDKDGIFWLATGGEGVIRWDKKEGTYQQFTIKDGLANDVIYAIYRDDFDNLWMSTDYGIIRMNKETFVVQNFLKKDGIGQTEFNRTSHFDYRNEKGEQQLFFGGLEGITTFYPKKFQETDKQVRPLLVILNYQHFSSQQQKVVDKTLKLRQDANITLYPNDYIHSLEVGLLNYDDVEANQYFYQLNGEDWQNQKNRLIQLGQLPYGTHQLKLKAKTISNVEAAAELLLTIVVRSPFYLTWWFIFLTIGSVSSLGFYLYKRRTTQLKQRQNELEKLVIERTEELQKDKQLIEKQATELQELDNLKSRFFANVSHELRTPLTLILGPISTALNGGTLDNRNFTLLTKAKQSGKGLLKLIGSILDLSKMESGKMELHETSIVLFPFLHRIISAFESHAQREGIRFSFEYRAEKNLQVILDKEKLEIILNNLLSNAMKFTPKGGEVIFNITDNQNNIEIIVKDTGQGIHSDDIENVFNRFYQSAQKNAPTEGGTGIGLALSREFVNLMNGNISVKSEWTKGSIFSVTLPRNEVMGIIETEELEPSIITIPSISIENQIANTSKKLLLVEDNHSLRDYLELILSPHYKIKTAENGQIALDILNQNQQLKNKQPDLIISDVMMPIMDGYQLLTILKSNDDFRNIPIVMLTARADMQDKLKALRIGVDDYLLKPFEEEELLVRIENLLANYEERNTFILTEIVTEPTTENIKTDRPIVTAEDHEWLEGLEKLILKEMNNSIFSNDYLAERLHISTQSLYRKIKKLTGLTPNKYIRTIRLQQAKILLEKGISVKETAYKVGFSDVEYFSKLFKKELGKLPSEYL